jgi:hypothetical protein
MTTASTFEHFRDSFLVACADAQVGSAPLPIAVEEFCADRFPDALPTWVFNVTATLANMGLGGDWSTLEQHVFVINGDGLAAAGKIREARRKKSLMERIQHIPRSDWISLGALAVALLALLKE